ncbi:PaaX family transcriptional regulator C-terminal domain-containing protein [[Mycobacterium] kokjensenii]|uniref:PaaX family transcriptional regulator C-terminal domain-containing protein n=1 Tax=[Mycobacterium] kokjensenii TaxID=3064287 RepID=A0ABN9MS21_9MYCO|nr:PaaX family transcriptional regulator C-terminal domain-containing protein [Mycolicibacter sp. MU0083]CAJ1494078.1 PaaX family transcriptional regulator C-terminal domain-containing protein [Mycolicibacter sp. MU0083]
MTARSVVLSVLLGAHPASATAAELIRLTADFEIKETALRVALTRLVAAGDLVRSASGYGLSERLLARQRRQDAALNPQARHWGGAWLAVVITSIGCDARTRAALRAGLSERRFAELREGFWMRPDNIDVELGPDLSAHTRLLTARDERPAELAAKLWDLDEWSRVGHELLTAMADAEDVPGRFMVAAAMVRHLRRDPVLPPELLPADWPGSQIRRRYGEFADELTSRRDSARPLVAT